MNKGVTMVGGATLGAGLMYLLDPDKGDGGGHSSVIKRCTRHGQRGALLKRLCVIRNTGHGGLSPP
jgi:hypothetical protein